MTAPRSLARIAAAFSLLALASCGDATEPDAGVRSFWAGRVIVVADAAGLHVLNETSEPIGFFALDQAVSPLIDWIPCVSADGRCPRLVPGGPHLVPFAQVVGYSAATTDAIFYWWHPLRAQDGTMRYDSVRVVRVSVGR